MKRNPSAIMRFKKTANINGNDTAPKVHTLVNAEIQLKHPETATHIHLIYNTLSIFRLKTDEVKMDIAEQNE